MPFLGVELSWIESILWVILFSQILSFFGLPCLSNSNGKLLASGDFYTFSVRNASSTSFSITSPTLLVLLSSKLVSGFIS